MGPALETFLTLFLSVLIVLVILGALTRPFWKRCYRFFVRWYEGDMRAEQERKREVKQRALAVQELREFCHDEEAIPERIDMEVARPEQDVTQGQPEIRRQQEMQVQRKAPQAMQMEVQIGGHTTETKDVS